MPFIKNTIKKAGAFGTAFLGATIAEHYGVTLEHAKDLSHYGAPILIVLSHLLTHISSDCIDPLKEEILEQFNNKNPDQLNHDIQKALIDSMEKAVKGIKILYDDKYLNQPLSAEAKKFLKNFKEEFIETFSSESGHILKDDEFKDLIYSDTTKQANEYLHNNKGELFIQSKLNEKLDKVFNRQIINANLKNLFSEKFIPLTQFYFGEALKHSKNEAPRRAMERMLSEETLAGINKLIELQEKSDQEIKSQKWLGKVGKLPQKKIDELKSLVKELNNPQKLEVQFGEALDEQFKDLIVQYKDLKTDTELIKNSLRRINKQITFNNRILIGVAVTSVIIATGFIVRNKLAPFDATFIVIKDTTITISTEYPDLQSQAKVTLSLDEKRVEEISSKKQATFLNINNNYLSKVIDVSIEDKLWESSVKAITLKAGVNYLLIRPNKTWAHFRGDIKYHDGQKINSKAKIQLGSDTTFYSKNDGTFDIIIPIKMRKENYSVSVYVNEKPFYTTIITATGYNHLRPLN